MKKVSADPLINDLRSMHARSVWEKMDPRMYDSKSISFNVRRIVCGGFKALVDL